MNSTSTVTSAAWTPHAPDGLMEAFNSYERALMANDLEALDDLFASGPATLRGDKDGLLAGHAAISEFRAGRGGSPARRLVRTEVQAIDDRHALVVAVTEMVAGGRGLQTQLWSRDSGEWKITAAHVSAPGPAFDRSIWRAVGNPLVDPEAEGPLSGLSVAVKDLYAVKGFAVGAGSEAWLVGSPIETTTAAAPAALLRAGARIAGIARTDEFAYSLAGTNTHYGTPPNPKAPYRVSGGSSSGSASAVSLGHATIGLGTDTGGSVRVPAAYQGLFGIRTTHGAVSVEGLLPLAPSFDTVGWLTRDAETLAQVGAVLLPPAGSEPVTPFTSVRVAPQLLALADADLQGAIEHALDEWIAEPSLPLLEMTDFDTGQLPDWLKAFQTVQGYEAWQCHGDWVSRNWHTLGPDVAARFRIASGIGKAASTTARRTVAEAAEAVRAIVGNGVLLVPSASSAAPLLRDAALGGETIEALRRSTIQLTCLAGSAGLPAVNVPLSTDEGLPCGLCLIGPAGTDAQLMELAVELSAAGLLAD